MKKAVLAILAPLLAFLILGCGSVKGASQVPTAETTASALETVVFTDPLLEQMVREAMGKPQGDITATEAEAVTSLKLANELQQSGTEQEQISDISGLEYFTNLEILDLSNQAIMDLSPLSGLTALRSLSLCNCPAEDYASLKQLTNLNLLLLDGSAIKDLSVVSGLNQLTLLSFANTQVGDLSPLTTLENLRFLYLKGCPIQDFAPLNALYPLLKEKDFTIAAYLSDLGFTYNRDTCVAEYSIGNVVFQICRSDWGTPPEDYLWLQDSILLKYEINRDYTLMISYSPDQQVYGLTISSHGGTLAGYVYLVETRDFNFGGGDRESAEQAVRAVFSDAGSDDILLAFIPVLNEMVKDTFSMTPDALYKLPNVRPTLLNLGFAANEENGYYEFIRKDDTPEGEVYHSICVQRPEWGEQDYDVRFFTSIKSFGLVITYDAAEQRFRVSADNQINGSYAVFDYYPKDDSVVDIEVSKDTTVEEFFTSVYNNPAVTDVYRYSVSLMEQYIFDTFGLSVDELYALPTGD